MEARGAVWIRRSGEVDGMLLLERRSVSPAPHNHRLLLGLGEGERTEQGRGLLGKGVTMAR